jgi:hypothetical protein
LMADRRFRRRSGNAAHVASLSIWRSDPQATLPAKICCDAQHAPARMW